MFLNKFTNNADDTPLHSSGYAEAARPNKIGSMSPQSFSQRLHIERNRQNVNRYHDSMLVHRHHQERGYQRFDVASSERPATESEMPTSRGRTAPLRTGNRLISDVVKPTISPRFTEPPTRGYNPYK